MEFYGLYKDLLGYIPDSLSIVKDIFTYALPVILLICAFAAAFFGLKLAVAWAKVTFFFFGLTVSARFMLPEFDLTNEMYFIMLGICISIGIVCAYFTKYLSRVQISVAMFMTVYASMPSFWFFFGEIPAQIISLIVALALAFLSVKYQYILTIITTAFSSSFIFFDVLDDTYKMKYKVLYAVIMSVLALAFQCFDNRERLKKTYKDVKMKAEKTKKEGEKAVHYIEEKHHEHLSHKSLESENKETEETQSCADDPDGNNADAVTGEKIDELREEETAQSEA